MVSNTKSQNEENGSKLTREFLSTDSLENPHDVLKIIQAEEQFKEQNEKAREFFSKAIFKF